MESSNESVVCREDGSMLVRVRADLYSPEALLQAAYLFGNRCFVDILPAEESLQTVILRPRLSCEPGDVSDENQIVLGRLFINELHDQELRVRIRHETSDIHRMIIAEAFAPLESEKP